ncbi:DsbE family thiol:disulfide interchange protein [Pelagibacteraceae bacterium]|jgi:cytochrome c biogenesis protein CcmG, thiol:disulfide interchange protein DsbE|nr:DsbE family thiol:disulfide interchange protein [Pelagibacteraceae bacterium]
MKKQFLKLPAIIFLFILLIFSYLLLIDRNPSEIPSALLNKNVPKFETDSLMKDEKFISSKEFGDEIVLVNFFATWCKPCRDEHEYIKLFSSKKKIKIIGINYKDNPKKAKQWLKNLGNPYSNIAIDKKGEIAINWGVYGIPETFFINSKGVIKYKHVGPITRTVYKKIDSLINNTN